MAEGQIPGTARRCGERQSGEAWLGLHGDQWRGAQLLDHGRQLRRIGDDVRIGRLCRAGRPRSRWLRGARLRRRLDTDGLEIGELRDQGPKLELGEQRRELTGIGRADAELLEVELHRHVAPQRHELARQARVVGLLQQRFARPFPGDVGGAGENGVEIAVGLEQLQCRLVAHTFHAGNVVRRVTDEREVIHDPLRRHAEPLAGVGLIHPLFFDRGLSTAARIQQRDPLADQLIEILIPRDDHRLQAVLRRPAGQRGHDVVGLIAVDRDDGDMKRIEDLADALE